jgi:hypothetical protein
VIDFTAGGFIYIAGSDLIAELRKDEHTPRKAVVSKFPECIDAIACSILRLRFSNKKAHLWQYTSLYRQFHCTPDEVSCKGTSSFRT